MQILPNNNNNLRSDFGLHADRFVIVSYNILADDNVSKHGELYEGMDPKVLDWTTRKRKLCKELRRYNPSILCLQVSRILSISLLMW